MKDFLTIVLSALCLSACVYSKGVVDKIFINSDHVKVFLSGPPKQAYEKICEIVMIQPALNGKKVTPDDVSRDLRDQAAKCGATAVYLESLKQPGKKVEISGYGINLLESKYDETTYSSLLAAVKAEQQEKVTELLLAMPTAREKRTRKDNKVLEQALRDALNKGTNCHKSISRLLIERYNVTIRNMRRFRGNYLFCSDLASSMFGLLDPARQRVLVDIAIQKVVHLHRDYQPIDAKKLNKIYNLFFENKQEIQANLCLQKNTNNDLCDRRLRIRSVANHLVSSSTTQLESKFMGLAVLFLEITRN